MCVVLSHDSKYSAAQAAAHVRAICRAVRKIYIPIAAHIYEAYRQELLAGCSFVL